MAGKFVVFIALLALANAGLVRRDAPAEANNAPKASYDAILQDISGSLQKFISEASGKAKEALETAKQNVDKHVADLRAAQPKIEEQAGQVSAQAKAASEAAVNEIKKLATVFQSTAEDAYKKLEPSIKTASDTFAKNIEELQKKLQEPAKQ